ncbi:hypothetical protein IACHDJAJ_00145 [Aeromonas phage vB_AdhS_TS3]|nr:hypothetical protein IACHDJAJ_00145 [Aeromonas phage vB_AdhS_TS3]
MTITVAQMLCIGKDCGLTTVYEAWSQVQSHWDAFFTYANFNEEQRVFNKEMYDLGILEMNPDPSTHGMYRWPEEDILIDTMLEKMGIKYEEPNWSEADQQHLDDTKVEWPDGM